MPHLQPSTGWSRSTTTEPAQPFPTRFRPVNVPTPVCGCDSNPDWDADVTINARVWLNTLHKRVSAHVRTPNSAKTGAAGNQHPSFSIDMSPFELTERKSLEAGLTRQRDEKQGNKLVRTWKGEGPYTAYKFCRTNLRKPYGQGSGVLTAPRKTATTSSVMTLAIPPITVKHIEGEDDLTMEVDFYLAVYMDSDKLILPSKSNQLYKQHSDPNALFTKMATYILGEMAEREFPLSARFRKMAGSEYGSEESELSSEEEGEEVGEERRTLTVLTEAQRADMRVARLQERKRKLASA